MQVTLYNQMFHFNQFIRCAVVHHILGGFPISSNKSLTGLGRCLGPQILSTRLCKRSDSNLFVVIGPEPYTKYGYVDENF